MPNVSIVGAAPFKCNVEAGELVLIPILELLSYTTESPIVELEVNFTK